MAARCTQFLPLFEGLLTLAVNLAWVWRRICFNITAGAGTLYSHTAKFRVLHSSYISATKLMSMVLRCSLPHPCLFLMTRTTDLIDVPPPTKHHILLHESRTRLERAQSKKSSKDSEASLDPVEAMQIRSTTLSASLQKLYLWEKKLSEEVKAEEKMRLLHDRKVKKLKRLDERGAEAQKIEATTNTIRELSTKIRMAIQVVDKISVKINKVRDEELWPQLHELIQGLSRMWKSMHECHHSQCQAIEGAKGLDAIAFPQNTSDIQLEASLQLEHDLINWTCRFTEWIGAQKGFVRALHGWLFKCLFIEPEVTADGVAPYSPGRAGAPPIFVICNQWNQSLDRISDTSEKEVIDSMRAFSMMVWHLRERDKGEMRQRMASNREMERKVKSLEREDVKMQKEIQALDKKMILSSGGADVNSLTGNVVYQSDTSNKSGGSFQAGLMRIFEAMDHFTSDSVKAYEELLQRTEEVVREQSKVS